MTFDSGAVELTLHCAAGRVARVALRCQRPRAAQILCGKPGASAVALVPLLFAVCGKAQGLAARLALAAAHGVASAVHIDAETAREAAREHLWHLLAHAERSQLAEGYQCILGKGSLTNFLRPLLGMEPSEWLALGKDQLLQWVAGDAGLLAESCRQLPPEPPAVAVPLLPPLDAAATLAEWPRLDDGLAGLPGWLGRAAETGALARQHGVPLIAALAGTPLLQHRLARLRELLDFAVQPGTGLLGCASAAPVAPGIGRATVETARGLLMHELTLENETVTEYVIVAPTEWNFHPQGALPGWLTGQSAVDQEGLRAQAAAAVAALDPCVVWHLDIH
ncbi:MAG TPA: hypothetical protein VI279_04840 [Rhodocyclaceae bacterium]